MAGENRIQIVVSADASSAKGALAEIRRSIDGLSGDVGGGSRATRELSGQLGGLQGSLGGIKSLAATLGLAYAFKEAVQAARQAVQVVDDYKRATIGIAANLTDTVRGTDEELRRVYENNRRYAEETYQKVELAAAKYFASGKEMIEAWQIMANKGVAITSDQDIDNLGVITDKIKLLTQGQSSSLQIAQETRAVMDGQARAGSLMAQLLEDRIGPSWEKQLAQAREEGRVLEFVAGQFKGIAAASGDVTSTLESQVSTMQTLADQIRRTGAKELHQDVVTAMASVNDWLEENKDALAATLDQTWKWIKSWKDFPGEVSAGFEDLYTDLVSKDWRIKITAVVDFVAGAINQLKQFAQERGLGEHHALDARGVSQADGDYYDPVAEAYVHDERRFLSGSGAKGATQPIYSPTAVRPDGASKDRDQALDRLGLSSSADQVSRRLAQVEQVVNASWRQTWIDWKNGLLNDQEYWGFVGNVDSVRSTRSKEVLDAAAKRGAAGGNAAARADIKGAGVLQRIEDEITSYEESLGGNRLGASIAKVERDHNRALTQIRADLVGAKGGVEALQEAEGKLGELRDLKVKQAEIRAYYEELTFWSENLTKVGELRGDPIMAYSGEVTKLQADLGRELEQITGTAAGKAEASWDAAMKASQQSGADTTAIWAGVADDWARIDQERIEKTQLLEERATLERTEAYYRRLGDAATLDEGYFAHKRQLLDNEITSLRGVITNETALRTYASKKYTDLARQELEARLDAQDNFLGYLGDYLSLEFGLYKDHVTRTREMWRELAASTANFVRSIGQDLQEGMTSYLDALLTNDAKKREEAWRDMLQNMLRDTIRWVADMAVTLARQTLFLPIMASIVGVDSSGLEGLGLSVAGGKGQGGGFSLGQLGKYAGYAKDGVSLMGGANGLVGSLDSWGMSTLGWGSMSSGGSEMVAAFMEAGMTKEAATQAALQYGGTMQAGTGLGSTLTAAGAGIAGGWLAGQFLRPDDSTSSYFGAAGGAVGGTAAALLGAGAWAGPVGMAVGAITAAITAAVTPETRTSTWGVPKASQPAVWIVDGEAVPASYGVIKTTSSGFGGSQSTSHSTIYDLASSEITAQVTAGMAAATAGLKSFAHSLGQSDEEFRATMKGVQSLMIAIPEGYEALVYRNLANLQGEEYLKRMGLIDQANGLLRSGESYIDLITRTETAATTAAAAFGVMGLQLETLSGSTERLIQGDWASQLIEAVGGGDAFVAVLNRYNKYAYDAAEQAERQLAYYGAKASEALDGMGGVGLTDFWAKYRERMEAGALSADEFRSWAEAAVWVEQAYTAATAAADQQVAAERERLTAMEATRRELESQRDAWEQARESIRDFVASMRTDQLSTLSPTAILAERRAAYEDVLGRARAGDLAAQAEYRDAAAAYREYAHGYYGANGEYAAIDQAIQADAAALISLADVHAQAANDQLEALLEQIEVSQAILESTTLVNENLARISSGQVAVAHMAAGGLVTGGTPGVDSVPALLMPGERVFSAPHSRIIERLAANTGMDTSTIERLLAQLLAAVATGNQSLTRLLERVDGNTASMASNLERA